MNLKSKTLKWIRSAYFEVPHQAITKGKMQRHVELYLVSQVPVQLPLNSFMFSNLNWNSKVIFMINEQLFFSSVFLKGEKRPRCKSRKSRDWERVLILKFVCWCFSMFSVFLQITHMKKWRFITIVTKLILLR